MTTRKIQTAPLPASQWPESLRDAFERAAARMAWPSSFTADVRRALENVLGFQAARVAGACVRLPSPGQVRSYVTMLRATLAPASVTTYVQHLYYALALVDPAIDWRWLHALYQELRVRQTAAMPDTPPKGSVVRRAKALRLKVEHWPEDLRAAWHAARQANRRGRYRNLDSVHPASAWSSSYAERIERGFGLFLGFLRRQGMEFALTPDTLEAFVGDVEERGVASISLASYVEEIDIAAKALLPDDWSWLSAAANRIRLLATPSRPIVTRIVPSQELFDLGLRLMREAASKVLSSASAILYRDGLMIALLARRPVRLRNLSEMRIGEHLVLRDAAGYLFFPATKNGSPYDAPLPAELVAPFRRWIEVYRPFLVGAAEDDFCWAGRDGRMMARAAISQRIGNVTEDRLGRRANPHAFRHALATTIAEHDRRKLRAVMILLGQRDKRVTDRHYDHANSMAAASELEVRLERFRRPPPVRGRIVLASRIPPQHPADMSEPRDGRLFSEAA